MSEPSIGAKENCGSLRRIILRKNEMKQPENELTSHQSPAGGFIVDVAAGLQFAMVGIGASKLTAYKAALCRLIRLTREARKEISRIEAASE